MINAIAKRIANYVCYNTESSDDKLYNYEIYVYGFEIILSSIVAFGIVLLFGLLFRTYISGEFTPSYATTGAYGTTKGKHIEQIYVKAHENAWPNSQMEKATLRNSSVSSNTRQYTYYTCKYFSGGGNRTVKTSDKTNSAECCFYGVGTLLQGYSTRYKVFCMNK